MASARADSIGDPAAGHAGSSGGAASFSASIVESALKSTDPNRSGIDSVRMPRERGQNESDMRENLRPNGRSATRARSAHRDERSRRRASQRRSRAWSNFALSPRSHNVARLTPTAGVARQETVGPRDDRGAMDRSETIDRVFHEGSDCAAALIGDVLVLVWDGPAHIGSAVGGAQRDAVAQARRAARTKASSVLNIVSERASPPDSAGRAIASKFPEHFDYHVQVAEGWGCDRRSFAAC